MKNNFYKPVEVHKRVAAAAAEIHYDSDLERQHELKIKLKQSLGLNRMPTDKPPLNVRTHWSRHTEYGEITKITFSSEAFHDIPAYVALPDKAKPPYKFFICLQGHSTGMHNSIAVAADDETTPTEVAGDRDFVIGCLKRGLAAIAIEVRGLGECEDEHENWTLPCHNSAMHALILGRTLLGERIFDVDRTIDYLAARGDVLLDQIGIIGNSGGGTVAMFAGALLDRLAYIMPSCCFASFKDSLMAVDHCMCNYVPGLMLFADCANIAALAAPKPLVIVSGKNDKLFPIDSARKEFAKVSSIYRQTGANNMCKHVIGENGHRFYAEQAWEAMQEFF